ncbi:MAG: OB-fold domain-containing protein [Leptospiraceae bacterium]|nr:OB-fold domain-containing protein [Leptospiraceae bacterium]
MNILKGKKCNSCSFLMLDPSFACPSCGSDLLSEIDFKGEGTIYTYTVVNVGFGHLAGKAPYVLAIVDLNEGLKVLTIVEDANLQTVAIGDKVNFKHLDERHEPIFQAA